MDIKNGLQWHEETLSWKSNAELEKYYLEKSEDIKLSNTWYELNSDNEVINVFLASPEIVGTITTNTCIQARMSGRIHYNASIGFTYNPLTDQFIPQQPYPSWILDETSLTWKSPVGFLTGKVVEVGVADGGNNYVTSTNVSTFNISSEDGNPTGTGLILNIVASNGVIIEPVSIVSPGTGYKFHDMVGIVTSSVSSQTGSGAQIGLLEISSII